VTVVDKVFTVHSFSTF